MVYTSISDLQFQDKKRNDLQYQYQMSKTTPRCLIDRGDELKLFKEIYKTKTPFCNSCTNNRGGNHPGCTPDRSCPHPEYAKYYLNEFLLVPCPKPTHLNYVECDDKKCCSIRHQLFRNNTKRKMPTPNICGQVRYDINKFS